MPSKRPSTGGDGAAVPRRSSATAGRAPDTGDERALLDWLAVMRTRDPVWRDDAGLWHVFRHRDVRSSLLDSDTFRADVTRGAGAPPEARRGMLAKLDPPEHRDLRRRVGQAFTPARVAGLERRIRRITSTMLDAIDDRPGTPFDLVDAVAFSLPVTVVAELLGLPPEDEDRFRDWADRLFALQVDDPRDPALQSLLEPLRVQYRAYLGAICRSRRADPRDDLVSALVCDGPDGPGLDDLEATNVAVQLLLAGHLNMTVTLCNAVRTFDENPGTWEELRDDPSRIPSAVEEVMRLRPPFVITNRITNRAVTIAGTELPPDSIVLQWLLSANHDPAVHRDPEVFDPSRGVTGSAQLALGHGVHFCLGAPLARLEARVALEEMTARWSGLSLVSREPDVLRPYTRGVLGTRRLPVVTR